MRYLHTPLRAVAATMLLAAPEARAGTALDTGLAALVEAEPPAGRGARRLDDTLLRGDPGAALIVIKPAAGAPAPGPKTVARVAAATLPRQAASLAEKADGPPDAPSMDKPARSSSDAAIALLRRVRTFTDDSFGARWHVRGGDAGWMPGVSWMADVVNPNGAATYRGPDKRPSLRAVGEWDLPQDFSLSVMPGVFRDRDDRGKHYASSVFAVTLGKTWTPRWRTFLEVTGQGSAGAQDSPSGLSLDTGLAFVARRSLRFDIAVSHGLSGTGPDMQGGVGMSAHF